MPRFKSRLCTFQTGQSYTNQFLHTYFLICEIRMITLFHRSFWEINKMMCVLCLAGSNILTNGGWGIFTTTSTITYHQYLSRKSVIKNVLRYPTKIKINYCFLEKKKIPGSTSEMCYHSYWNCRDDLGNLLQPDHISDYNLYRQITFVMICVTVR